MVTLVAIEILKVAYDCIVLHIHVPYNIQQSS